MRAYLLAEQGVNAHGELEPGRFWDAVKALVVLTPAGSVSSETDWLETYDLTRCLECLRSCAQDAGSEVGVDQAHGDQLVEAIEQAAVVAERRWKTLEFFGLTGDWRIGTPREGEDLAERWLIAEVARDAFARDMRIPSWELGVKEARAAARMAGRRHVTESGLGGVCGPWALKRKDVASGVRA